MGDDGDSMHPAFRRLVADPDVAAAFDVLTERLSGADLTTLLLEVFGRRAESVSAADVMRGHRSDRFVEPSSIDALALTRVGLAALEATSPSFDPLVLAPVVPLGTHHATGATPQNNVVSTIRMTEVAADPTNSLALEAAVRRARLLADEPRSAEAVRLSAVHRVTRAQVFDGPRSFAHFALLGLVAAGRDCGNYTFEAEQLSEQIRTLIAVVRTTTPAPIEVRLSAFNSDLNEHCGRLAEDLASDTIATSIDPDREHGRGYYRNLCFKLHVAFDGEWFELGDGGDVRWTADLLQNRKERLVIAGLGLDRLAMLA